MRTVGVTMCVSAGQNSTDPTLPDCGQGAWGQRVVVQSSCLQAMTTSSEGEVKLQHSSLSSLFCRASFALCYMSSSVCKRTAQFRRLFGFIFGPP